MSNNNSPKQFPAGFTWGTATASYQIEGGAHEDGRGPSIWDTFAKTGVLNQDNGDVACDHYHRYGEDLDLLKNLGVSSYRFSIAWPRIQADGTGAPNQKGLDFYRRLVDGLRERDIAPAITLYHWDLPQALEDKGGWVNRDTAYRLADYTGHVVDALGDDVARWITINEPWCVSWLGYGIGVHAPGIQDIGKAVAANHHILLAHGLATQVIREKLPEAQVGITLNMALSKSATDHELDQYATAVANGNHNGMFMGPIFKGEYPEIMREHYATASDNFAVVQPGDLEIISAPLDFLGVNHYSYSYQAHKTRVAEARAAGFNYNPGPANVYSEDMPGVPLGVPGRPRTAIGWEVDETGISDLLLWVKQEYTDLPIYITENGAAYQDYVNDKGEVNDNDRIAYLNAYMGAVNSAREQGVNVQGYYVWSLMDNFEWAEGYSKRFGIVWVDYPTGTRTPKASYYWYQNVIKTNRLPE